ncbi:phage tail protein, partial [Novacetimonas hansenii]|nr:phage tail protein [Novacetimonas hansenii]
MTGVALTVMPPTDAGRFTLAQRNSLLHDGISTFTVDDSGTVNIERLVTTYQENAEGVPDDSYLDIETLMTAMICLQDMRIYLASMFAGFILVADGTKISAGAKATTAQLIGKACAARYNWQCSQLWAQNAATFAASLQSQNQGGGQVFLLMPYDFANQLWVIAG